ncbi:DUF4352 domain-containing protein [Nocardia nova]|uniref:DUF4352 domain-containing protein n=1 Tax=Nocardia nova TaxID=37330 RepID=UPI0033DA420C
MTTPPPPYPPYNQPYPAPPYPPPRRKPVIWPWILIGGLVLMCGGCFGLVGIAGNSSTSATKANTRAHGPEAAGQPAAPPSAPITPPEPKVAAVGAEVRDGKFAFVVTDVQTGLKEIGDNPYLERTAQGMYTIVTMTVHNTSDVPRGFSPGNQDLYDAQNRKFGNDAAAAINLKADTSLYADINPGNTITAKVVFDLPADTQPDRIVLHDSMFSGGATVSLR